jgi:hypothetical protein
MNRRRAGIGWTTAIVLVLTAMAGTAGTTAAMGADDPTPAATSTDGASPSAGTPSGTTATGSAAAVATDTTTPSAPTTSSDPTATATPTEGCPLCPPKDYIPPNGSRFNHPFNPASASDIRTHVTSTVKSVPSGGTIRLALFSLNDDALADALIAAVKRGVSVQIVANNHNITNSIPGLPPSPSFKRLVSVLGSSRTEPGKDPQRVSFARICRASCRGHGGNVHYKMFLFSIVGKDSYDPATGVARDACPPDTDSTCRQWVTMMGSPNLTTKAAYGQWNHLDTYANKDTYDLYQRWWAQMKADTPRASPYEREKTGGITSWTFPKPGTTASNDPLMLGLNGIRCKGVGSGYGINGRTKIRIGAYTFFDDRGRWISKKVRSLWNSGCDVAIEYSIMGDRIKRLLYSPSGRGRIPMRQVVTFKKNGDIDAYDHAKWIAMSGNWGGDGRTTKLWTGTTNISDLGFRSDDTGQVYVNSARVGAYMNDFSELWRSNKAHVPSPTSRLNARIGSPELTLGQGRYAAMEPE